MALDTGASAVAVDEDGVLINTKLNEWGAKQLSIYNSGSEYVYANINSTAAIVKANAAAGGAVAIAPKAVHTWQYANIESVAVACASGKTSTIDWAALSG
jgi:hypothetical protein